MCWAISSAASPSSAARNLAKRCPRAAHMAGRRRADRRLTARLRAYEGHMDAIEVRKAAAELRAIWAAGNEYLQAPRPGRPSRPTPTARRAGPPGAEPDPALRGAVRAVHPRCQRQDAGGDERLLTRPGPTILPLRSTRCSQVTPFRCPTSRSAKSPTTNGRNGPSDLPERATESPAS